eukprot:gene22357-biopygen17731
MPKLLKNSRQANLGTIACLFTAGRAAAVIAAPQAPPKGKMSEIVTPQAPPGLATGLQHAHSPHGHSGHQPSVALDTRPGPTFDEPNCWWAGISIVHSWEVHK